MKIAGDHPSHSLLSHTESPADSAEYEKEKTSGNLERAKALGKALAGDFVAACKKDELTVTDDDSEGLFTQKILLLSFTVMAGLEQFCPSIALANTARTAFFDELYVQNRSFFDRSSDTGAFSFYYLSFRRGIEVDRRVGQTFAMLCSHDGDPIYQELGEALYCWFSSVIQRQVKACGFVKE